MENASSSSPTETMLIEKREEVMVSEKGPSLRKTHFLKPFASIDDGGSVAELPRRHQRHSVSSSGLNRLSSRCSFSGFWFAPRDFLAWLRKMEALHEPTWRKAGILEAIKASTHNITKNPSLILSLAENWCPETKSFIFPWGEATVTLEDVMVLLGFSVLGSSVFAPLESSEMRDSAEKLETVVIRLQRGSSDGRVTLISWISSFLDIDDEMEEHEAFLVLWLSFYVFPGKTRCSISKNVIPIAVRLARGEPIALAPTVLANIYRDLGRIHGFARQKCDHKVNLKSLLKLVQVWTWERFRNMRPEAKEIPKGEPRISRWVGVKQKLLILNFDDFDWRPYTKALKNWNPLRFYVEEAMWVTVEESVDTEFASFARCMRSSQLPGNGFVEDYYPNRVAMQFGLDQDLPALVTHEAWDIYDSSVDGLKLYMPCRLARGSVTVRYRDWWVKSVSEFMCSEVIQRESSDETFDARNTCDHRDDDVSPKILPLSQVVQKLEQGFPANLRRSRTTRKSVKKLRSLQVKRASEDDDMDEEDDDNMTVAERIKYCRNKYSVAEKTGKRSRKFQVVDSDDSGSSQNLNSISKIQMTRHDDEVDGNSAEKKSNESIMQSIGRDEAERALEDGEKQRGNEVKKEQDNIDERLKKREIAINEIALKLEQRINKEKKSLTEIREWITKNGVSF